MSDDPVTAIPFIGPVTAQGFARAGITTACEIRALGPDEAYRRLLAAGTAPHFMGYLVLLMGLQNRPWNDAQAPEKKVLRKRFDAIKASVGATGAKGRAGGKKKGRPDIETALSFFGVLDPKG